MGRGENGFRARAWPCSCATACLAAGRGENGFWGLSPASRPMRETPPAACARVGARGSGLVRAQSRGRGQRRTRGGVLAPAASRLRCIRPRARELRRANQAAASAWRIAPRPTRAPCSFGEGNHESSVLERQALARM